MPGVVFQRDFGFSPGCFGVAGAGAGAGSGGVVGVGARSGPGWRGAPVRGWCGPTARPHDGLWMPLSTVTPPLRRAGSRAPNVGA